MTSFERFAALGLTVAVVTLNVDRPRAQSQTQSRAQALPQTLPTFDVASVKPHRTGDSIVSLSPVGGDRLAATNVSLRLLVQWSYPHSNGRLYLDSQIIGGPRWMDTERFDVQSKAEAGPRPVPIEQLRLMAQSLLQDRFQLRTHREIRELPVYALVSGKTGANIKLADDQTPVPANQRRVFNAGGPQPRGTLVPSRSSDGMMTLSGAAIPMLMLASVLQGYVDRPVIDATNLRGLFDLRLEFSGAVPAGSSSGTSPGAQASPAPPDLSGGLLVFTAIQEQLGLKLEPAKRPVEVLIIDRAEHPTPD